MTESIESISDRIVYGDGYNPKKIDESVKAMARDLVCEVYADQYQPRYLELVAAGHKDDEYEMELAVTAILAERERCASVAESYSDGVYAAQAIRGER